MKAGYCRNDGNANKVRSSSGQRDDDVQADHGNRVSSQWKVNEQGNPAIGSGSGSTSLTQLGSLPEGGSFDGASANGGVTVDKGAILTVKKHVPDFKEFITEIDRAIQTDSDFSNSKATPTDCVPDNSEIAFALIEVVVMDEDTIILNRDLMGKQGEQISSPSFEGSEICFKVGCGNEKGNKSNSKGRPKRSGSKDKGVSQSMHSPKVVESVEKFTIGSLKVMMNWKRLTSRPQTLINSSIVDVELGQKRKQVENMNKEVTVVKGEKKHRTVEYEQDVMSTMGSTEVAGQEDTPKRKKKKKLITLMSM